MKNENNSSKGVGILGVLSVLLTVAFVVLKLMGYISWAWIWVFAPLWGYVALSLLVIIVVFVTIGGIIKFINRK